MAAGLRKPALLRALIEIFLSSSQRAARAAAHAERRHQGGQRIGRHARHVLPDGQHPAHEGARDEQAPAERHPDPLAQRPQPERVSGSKFNRRKENLRRAKRSLFCLAP